MAEQDVDGMTVQELNAELLRNLVLLSRGFLHEEKKPLDSIGF